MFIILTKYFYQIHNKMRYLKKLNHLFNLPLMEKILAYLPMDKQAQGKLIQWKDQIRICCLIKLIAEHMNFLGFCQELQYLFKKSLKDKNVLEKNYILRFLR